MPALHRFARLVLLASAVLAAPPLGWADPTYTIIHNFTGVDGGGYPNGVIGHQPEPNTSGGWALYGTTGHGGGSRSGPGCGTTGCGVVYKLTPPASGTGPWAQTVLHHFQLATGAYPPAPVVFDPSGAMYGTTTAGGPTGNGTVFRLTQPAPDHGYFWNETILHSFGQPPDGNFPDAGVVIGSTGAIYATTANGGLSHDGGVFAFAPPAAGATTWAETTLHLFTPTVEENFSEAPVLVGPSGILYGVTQSGSGYGGTVFSLTPPARGQSHWVFATLYTFGANSSDGMTPLAGLIMDGSGALYGTTERGGTAGYGTVFKLTPPPAGSTAWTETRLYSFTGGADGSYPDAPVIRDAAGALYGTTLGGGVVNATCVSNNGCGVFFKLSPPAAGESAWTQTVLHAFHGGQYDGWFVTGALTMAPDGSIYGTTAQGGWYNAGVVFKITP